MIREDVVLVGRRIGFNLFGNVVVSLTLTQLVAVVQDELVAEDLHDVVAHLVHVDRRRNLPVDVVQLFDHFVLGAVHRQEVIVLGQHRYLIQGNVLLEDDLVQVVAEVAEQRFGQRGFTAVGNAGDSDHQPRLHRASRLEVDLLIVSVLLSAPQVIQRKYR
uniref:(northern house mosquito) hypothetical protein n=1 Tax=Culex pipiens TaxID=7175 RepID=A0A8D8G1Y2_CULPI